MSIQMDGQYANQRFTQECDEVTHGFAGTQTLQKDHVESGYAEMSGEWTKYVCECGEDFDSHDELNYHIADMNAAQVAHASNVNSRFLISALMGGF